MTRAKKVELDFSFVEAASLVLPPREMTRLYLVGCGGTGSWIAPTLARLAAVMMEANRPVEVTFIDPDKVEHKNVPRQNFAKSEVGMYKPVALAHRFSSHWSVEIRTVCELFSKEALTPHNDALNIIVGAVDNPKARRVIADVLLNPSTYIEYFGYGYQKRTWWLDCGNHEDAGQVLLGNVSKPEGLRGAFNAKTICTALPSPALQSPDLLQDETKKKVRRQASCAELMLANAQSLTINQKVAAEAADYLMRLLTGMPLKRFQTWMDAEAGTSRSVYITPENVARVIEKPARFVQAA